MMMIASATTVAIDCDLSFVMKEQLASKDLVIHILSATTLSSINTCSPRAAPLYAQAATRSWLCHHTVHRLRSYRSFNTQSDPILQYTTHVTTL